MRDTKSDSGNISFGLIGVMQGSPNHPYLFYVYIEDLLNTLMVKHGLSIEEILACG